MPGFHFISLLKSKCYNVKYFQGDEGHLSDVMPDVALASSSLSALHLGTSALDDRAMGSLEGLEDLEVTQMSLDLGDGSHHQVGISFQI